MKYKNFSLNGKPIDLSVIDFWQFEFSNLVDLLGYVAEFLVAKALGKDKPDNCNGWTPYDIKYKGKRIEVKATSYYQTWKQEGKVCNIRRFSIRRSQRENSDIYVFCLLNGMNSSEANPLLLDNWEFYVVPSSFLDKECGNNKTISLSRIRKFDIYGKPVNYSNIPNAINSIIEE